MTPPTRGTYSFFPTLLITTCCGQIPCRVESQSPCPRPNGIAPRGVCPTVRSGAPRSRNLNFSIEFPRNNAVSRLNQSRMQHSCRRVAVFLPNFSFVAPLLLLLAAVCSARVLSSRWERSSKLVLCINPSASVFTSRVGGATSCCDGFQSLSTKACGKYLLPDRKAPLGN